jgi:L-seryl-tRNA(Ser) seleniumtransferase
LCRIIPMEAEFRSLPGVDKILGDARISGLKYPHDLLVGLIRDRLEQARRSVAAGGPAASPDDIIQSVLAGLTMLESPGLRRVVNASGVVIHTNLGRAPLSADTLTAMAEISRGYSNLEFDLESGVRGSRHTHIEGLLCQLTGAEAALVVNNNAAAVLLALTALTRRKEVIVSRGQAVEIGGGFRIPDVMRQSGAKLVEVGTTNRTYPDDYEQAISERTAALMRVHSSNFRVVGFTSEVAIEELAGIGRKHGIMVIDDVGSGCLLDTTAFGLAPEPRVQDSVRAGATLTLFSGDKPMGGPQAGVIVGQKEYVARLKKHPLVRAMRIDKGRLAGLVATVRHFLKGEATSEIPIWRMIATPVGEIEKRAAAWAKAAGGPGKVVPGETMVGGGSLPGGSLPTYLLVVRGSRQESAQAIGRRLRQREVPVIGRIEKDRLLLDPRTVLPEEDEIVIKALREIMK